MFQSFYNGLSGMYTSAKALDVVSDNVANMQTPGFKAKDVFMANVSGGGEGLGAQLADVGYRFSQGEVTQTGNKTDLFLDGRALFVLKDGNDYYYTRAGMFSLNDENKLVDRLTGYEVVGIDDRGSLGSIEVGDNASIDAIPTTSVSLKGSLTTKDTSVEMEKVGYIASDGSYQELSASLELSNEEWKVSIKDDEGNEVGTGSLEFDLGGTLKVGKNEG